MFCNIKYKGLSNHINVLHLRLQLTEQHLIPAERSVKKPAPGKRLLLIVHKKRARDAVLNSSINRLIRDGHDVQVDCSSKRLLRPFLR